MAVFAPRILDRWRAWDSGARQRAGTYWRSIVASDPELKRARVTVELQIGGRLLLLAVEPLATSRKSTTGERMSYIPALISEPSVARGVTMGNQAAASVSTSIEFPASLLDPSELIGAGAMMAGVGEIALQVDGGDYDLRWVLFRGSITGGVSFGGPGETISVSLTDMRDIQERLIPEWLVDEDSWPDAQDAAVGARIPRVYNGGTAIPALRVLDDHGGTGLRFASSDRPDGLTIAALYVNGVAVASGDPTYGWALIAPPDGKGRRTLVTDHSSSAGPWAENDAVHHTLALKNTATKGVLQIARELLGEYTALGPLGLDLDLFTYAESRIEPTAPHVVINASGADTPGVLSFIEGGLLASFPMVHLLYSGAGLGATVIDRRVGPGGRGMVGAMTGGRMPLFERASDYTEVPKSEMFTDFELRYDYNPLDRSYAGVITRDPGSSAGCKLAAEALGGRKHYGMIESPYIVSETEARYVIDWLVAHRSVPHYTVEWVCSASLPLRYRVGQNIRYTDPDFPVFTDAVATITSLGFERGSHTVGLIVWHPAFSLSMHQQSV